MRRIEDRRTPRGFGAPADCLDSLRPEGATTLVVPRDLRRAGPHLLWPAASGFGCILVERVPESLGSPEAWFVEAAARLAPGGRLVVSVENTCGIRSIRRALEGKPAGLDPHGAPGQREIGFEAMRLVRALSAAGLVPVDLLEAQAWNDGVPEGFVPALLAQGLLASRYVWGAPPERLWCVAEKAPVKAASALVAVTTSSEPAALSRTLATLATACPTVEVVVGERTELDVDSWNEAVTRSSGRWIWCLRAGDQPAPGDFEALAARVEFGPATPSVDRVGMTGDLGGLLVERDVLLGVGPFPREWESERIAGEEWFLRAELLGFRAEAVTCGYRGVVPASGPMQQEGETLVSRYGAFLEDQKPVAAGGRSPAPPPWAGREPTITLCMIARDEERFLPACLDSVRGAADEIVLVDTGSKDATVAIARSRGAVVLRSAWADDFSAPRNLGLRAATSDWILVLDADEILRGDAVRRIREASRDPGISGWHFNFTNAHESQRSHGVLMVRMFRNLPGVRYENRIHEQVVPSLLDLADPMGLRLGIAPVEVIHNGYTDAMMKDRRKNERNVRLFRLQLEEHPDDVYSLYKFGDFLRRIEGHGDEVLAVLTRTYELIRERPPSSYRSVPFAGEAAALLGLELAKRGRQAEAAEVLETALALFMPTPDLHYVAAGFLLKTGRPAEAAHHYRRCLAFRDVPLVVPVQDGITAHVGLAGLATALLEMGEFERAEHLLRGVLAGHPGHDVAALSLSALLMRTGRMREALEPLIVFLRANPDGGLARYQGALLLLRMGMAGQAAAWAERAVASGKLPGEANRVLAESRIRLGDLDGAGSAFAAGAAAGDEVCLIGCGFVERRRGNEWRAPAGVPEKGVRELTAKWDSWMEAAGEGARGFAQERGAGALQNHE